MGGKTKIKRPLVTVLMALYSGAISYTSNIKMKNLVSPQQDPSVTPQNQKPFILLCLILFIFTFVFIRIYNKSDVFMIPRSGDDAGYFAYTVAFLDAKSLNWCNDAFKKYHLDLSKDCREQGTLEGRVYNRYSVGPAIILLPFTLIISLIAKWSLLPMPSGMDPLSFGIVIGTYGLLLGSVYFLYHLALLCLRRGSMAFWMTLFFITGNTALFYFFRRPMMSHAAEFFVFSACCYYCFKALSLPYQDFYKNTVILGLFSGLLFLTRINNIHFAVIFLFMLLLGNKSLGWFLRMKRTAVFAACIVPGIVFFYLIQWAQTGHFGYTLTNYASSFTFENLMAFRWSNIRRVWDFFFGVHWGIVWLMPFYLFEIFIILSAASVIARTIVQYKILSIVIISIVLIYFNMMANLPNHMCYGFRLLIPYYITLHVLFLISLPKSALFSAVSDKLSWKIKLMGSVMAIIAALNLMNFQSNTTTLTLTEHRAAEEGIYDPQRKEKESLSCPYYAVNSLKHIASGKALFNLGASPLIAYPIFMINMSDIAPLQNVYDYYRSPKRDIHDLNDLITVFFYHLYTLCLTVLFIVGYIFFQRKHGKV